MKKKVTLPNGTSKWLGYSGMATAFIAVAPQADAQVIYTDVDPDAVIIDGDYNLDFDGDGNPDLTFLQVGATSSAGFNAAFLMIASVNQVLGSNAGTLMYPALLASGDPVGPGGSFQSATFGTLAFVGASSNVVGNWSGQTGYLGCRFEDGDGLKHYAWVELAVAPDAGSITVLAYGYESTPNVGIDAGTTGPTGIANAGSAAFNFSLAPNPVRSITSLTFLSTEAGEVQVAILNGMGQVVQAERRNAMVGDNSFQFDLTGLAEGTYFVRLQCGGQVAFRKVTKVN